MPDYDRDVLVHVVTYHGRNGIEGCRCGWSVLGKSHSEHVANVYEAMVAGKSAEGKPMKKIYVQRKNESTLLSIEVNDNMSIGWDPSTRSIITVDTDNPHEVSAVISNVDYAWVNEAATIAYESSTAKMTNHGI